MNDATITAVQSGSAAVRLRAARRFLDRFEPGDEVLLLGASRGAADDLARAISLERGATFGLHRLSFTQLAARLAVLELATRGRAPATALGHEAVATRAVFEAQNEGALRYFSPVSRTPGFPRALARTLLELRLDAVSATALAKQMLGGPDLAALLDRVETLLVDAGAGDRAALFETATAALDSPMLAWPPMPLVLLDVPFDSDIEAGFLWSLIRRAPQSMITVPAGDVSAARRLGSRGVRLQVEEETAATDLAQLARCLFSKDPPPERHRSGELVWFSAPGEGRECLEIARRILKEAERGVRFDETAIIVRSTEQYAGVLEHALARAGVPAYFERGTRRPDPAGRAFLALVSCATENFSAKRFAEYLSLAQVPALDDSGQPSTGTGDATWAASRDDVFGVLSERAPEQADATESADEPADGAAGDQAVVAGTLRAPWKWESLLVESAVIGGSERWARRLNGLEAEYELKIRELSSEQPDSPRIARLERERQNLAHLRAFALPLIEQIASWPREAKWGEWLERLEELAPRVLRRPEFVLRVLADLRPMAGVGPISLAEARDVLAERLASLEVEPPGHRYGRVFVCTPEQVRGRVFRVAFVPGLAERLFPQRLREDPLLPDDLRRALDRDLSVQEDRAERERLLLRLAAGAATDRLYVSFPRIETLEARARVPSFYALEIMRAVTGRIPEHQALELEASEEASASLAWPAPLRPEDAIDDFEHDLSVLRGLMRSAGDAKGRAHYMLRLNDCVRRSASERWARGRPAWSPYDGLVRVTERTRPFLDSQRLGARPYSVSALQHYAYCPYRFLLSALYYLQPLEQPEPLQHLDPLTKGSLFHEVLAEFFRALEHHRISIGAAPIEAVLEVLDATLTRVAAKYAEMLAPAIERVWQDEIAAIRTDLHIWARDLTRGSEWQPWLFEFAFGLPNAPGTDPHSVREPVTIDGRFILRGSVDLVERRPGTKLLRVTDHKTSKNRSEPRSIIGGGRQLQPVVYSLAVEAATGCTVETARFSYCTTAGGFTEHNVPINEQSRSLGIEALEIIDRAVELGMLPAAPAEKACAICDFLPVCGPNQERRARRKSPKEIGDLLELRRRP
ncbi:MAG TPA: PD-(D/E)XK nuclease family protein [Candidatus Eisenbacteria bacterium]|nr:PD-(D/E)XK nuclease family protein [Candidatus Eisenbacteria bacterium]